LSLDSVSLRPWNSRRERTSRQRRAIRFHQADIFGPVFELIGQTKNTGGSSKLQIGLSNLVA
jgi:hypothetical protein